MSWCESGETWLSMIRCDPPRPLTYPGWRYRTINYEACEWCVVTARTTLEGPIHIQLVRSQNATSLNLFTYRLATRSVLVLGLFWVPYEERFVNG